MILAKGTVAAISQPLAQAPAKSSYVVDRVVGCDQRRLSEMGLVEGAEVSVINRSRGGMMVVKVGGCRLGLAKATADCVMVK